MNTQPLTLLQGSDWAGTLKLDAPAKSAKLQARWNLSDATPALDLTAAVNGDLARFTIPAAVSSAITPQGKLGLVVVKNDEGKDVTVLAYTMIGAVEAVGVDDGTSQPWRGVIYLLPEVVRG